MEKDFLPVFPGIGFNYPRIHSLNLVLNGPLCGPRSVALPGCMLKFMFGAGLAFSAYLAFKILYYTSNSLLTYLRTFFNAKKYLASEVRPSQQPQRYYAVVYGSANKPGCTFAHFLAEKGFNLILIERSMQPLNDLELELNKLPQAPIIHKVVLNKFEEDSLAKHLGALKDLPVKLFVNCKNAKRKDNKQRRSKID